MAAIIVLYCVAGGMQLFILAHVIVVSTSVTCDV